MKEGTLSLATGLRFPKQLRLTHLLRGDAPNVEHATVFSAPLRTSSVSGPETPGSCAGRGWRFRRLARRWDIVFALQMIFLHGCAAFCGVEHDPSTMQTGRVALLHSPPNFSQPILKARGGSNHRKRGIP